MIKASNFDRINNDVNGNPRYVIHYLTLGKVFNDTLSYEQICKKANKLGGRKYNNKSYGGGVVFQSYSLDALVIRLNSQGE